MFKPRKPEQQDDRSSRIVIYSVRAVTGESVIPPIQAQLLLLRADVEARDAQVVVASHVETIPRPWVPPLHRPGLRSALRSLKSKRAGVLLVIERTRLGHSFITDQVPVVQIVSELGARIQTVSGGLAPSASGRVLGLDLMNALSRYRTFVEEEREEHAEALEAIRALEGWPPVGEPTSMPGDEPESLDDSEE